MTRMLFLMPLALGAAVPAIGAEPLPVATRNVVTADLDLSTGQGRAALDRRLARAAADVCGRAADIDLDGRNAVRDCRTEALGQARITAEQRIASVNAGQAIEVAAR